MLTSKHEPPRVSLLQRRCDGGDPVGNRAAGLPGTRGNLVSEGSIVSDPDGAVASLMHKREVIANVIESDSQAAGKVIQEAVT